MANPILSQELLTFTMAHGTTSAEVSLSKGQTLANCVGFMVGANYDGNVHHVSSHTAQITRETSPDAFAVTRGSSSGDYSCQVMVWELDPAKVDVGYYTTSLTSVASVAIAISSVDQTATFPMATCKCNHYSPKQSWVRPVFTGDEELTVYIGEDAAETTFVTVFTLESLDGSFSVQTCGGTGATADLASTVDLSKTILIGAHTTTASGDRAPNKHPVMLFVDSNTVECVASSASTSDTWIAYAVEWGGDETVTHGVATIATDTVTEAETISIDDVDLTMAWNAMHQTNSECSSTSTAEQGRNYARFDITSTTNMDVDCNQDLSFDQIVPYQLFEFTIGSQQQQQQPIGMIGSMF